MAEFGDFSHHRPVLLPGGGIQQIPRRTAHPAADLAAAAAATADRYFDLGYDGIAWKVTEGLTYEDPTWRGAYATAVRRGKWFLGYHFDRAAFDGGAQFDWFLSRLLAGAGGRLRPAGMDRLCLDSEDTQTPLMAQQSALGFTRRAVAAGYPAGCVYSAPWFDSYTRPATVRLDLLPAGWQVGWVSDYTASQPDASIELPAGWDRGRVWARQYTSTKPGLPGLPEGCDFNRELRPWPGQAGDDTMSATDADRVIAEVRAARDVLYNMARAQTPDGRPDPGHAEMAMTVANARLTALAGTVTQLASALAAVGRQVGALTDDEAHVLAAVAASDAATRAGFASLLAAGGETESKLIAAISAVPSAPGGGVDAAAVVAALRDTLIAGTAGTA
jgi:hypothetical protein